MSNELSNSEFPFLIRTYNEEQTHLKCAKCVRFYHISQCEIHKTPSGKKYPICPNCMIKHPMRSNPRNKRFLKKRMEYKRIE